MVFTVPEALHAICMLDSKWFYKHLFATVWDTLRSFGYTHYAAESGAICVLHTWGQNLSLHPHIHCIVPALGYTLKGELKHIGKQGKYLYPVIQLSEKFRGKFMAGVKSQLAKGEVLSQYKSSIEKTIPLAGEEFLRRFCLHILPSRFVKIRYYGIYSTRFRTTILNDKEKMAIKPVETTFERITRLMGIDVRQCPCCKKGHLVQVATLPRIRPPPVFVSTVII